MVVSYIFHWVWHCYVIDDYINVLGFLIAFFFSFVVRRNSQLSSWPGNHICILQLYLYNLSNYIRAKLSFLNTKFYSWIVFYTLLWKQGMVRCWQGKVSLHACLVNQTCSKYEIQSNTSCIYFSWTRFSSN